MVQNGNLDAVHKADADELEIYGDPGMYIRSQQSRSPNSSESGFTILELMIATSILTTILLLVTIVMISIGNLYYKGIAQARVQDATRTITDEISQQLQLNGQALSAASWSSKHEQAYCIGQVRYTYVLGTEIGKPTPGSSPGPVYQHILWRDTNPTPGSCSIDPGDTGNVSSVNLALPTPSAGGTEMIGPSSRLTALSITSSTGVSPYRVVVGVASGDDDLLCNPSLAGSCTAGTAMTNWSRYQDINLKCKGKVGDQFCSTARLQTTAVQRL
jgi:type II secretory pathway pseudopilin PulG